MLVNIKRCFTRKRLGRKSCCNQKIWIFSERQRIEKQTSVAKKQYQKFDNVFESNKKEEDRTKNKNRKSRTKSNLVYNKYFAFYKYHNTKEFAAKHSFVSKQNDLKEFKNILELFNHDSIESKPTNEDQIKDLKNEKLCSLQLLNDMKSF